MCLGDVDNVHDGEGNQAKADNENQYAGQQLHEVECAQERLFHCLVPKKVWLRVSHVVRDYCFLKYPATT